MFGLAGCVSDGENREFGDFVEVVLFLLEVEAGYKRFSVGGFINLFILIPNGLGVCVPKKSHDPQCKYINRYPTSFATDNKN